MTLLPSSIAASSIAWPISSAVDGRGWRVRACIGQWARATLSRPGGGLFWNKLLSGSPAAAANRRLAGGGLEGCNC